MRRRRGCLSDGSATSSELNARSSCSFADREVQGVRQSNGPTEAHDVGGPNLYIAHRAEPLEVLGEGLKLEVVFDEPAVDPEDSLPATAHKPVN